MTELRPLPASVQALVDRAEIVDCYTRYARGVDRLDEELVLSAFHDDCVDWHGELKLSPREFVASYWQRPVESTTQHYIGNYTIEIDGDSAHCEAYYTMVGRLADTGQLVMTGGRYVDRLERREGAWRIAARVLVREWRRLEDEWSGLDGFLAAGAQSRRDRGDYSYQRPLRLE